MWTADFIIKLLFSTIATACYSVVVHIRLRHLPFATIGGAVSYFVFYMLEFYGASYFVAAFVATAAMAALAEVFARIGRAPSLIFLFAGAIPLVPGGLLYRTMNNMLSKNYEAAKQFLGEALAIGLGIAGGMVAVSLTATILTRSIESFKAKHRGSSNAQNTEQS